MKLVLAFFLLVLSASPAWAYIDPGTGSMILQAIIGAVVAGLVAMKFYWTRVRAFLLGKRAETPNKTE